MESYLMDFTRRDRELLSWSLTLAWVADKDGIHSDAIADLRARIARAEAVDPLALAAE